MGVTIVSENEDGTLRVSAHDGGTDYHGLDDAEVVMIENVLLDLQDDMHTLNKKFRAKMVEIGFAITGTSPGDNAGKGGNKPKTR